MRKWILVLALLLLAKVAFAVPTATTNWNSNSEGTGNANTAFAPGETVYHLGKTGANTDPPIALQADGCVQWDFLDDITGGVQATTAEIYRCTARETADFTTKCSLAATLDSSNSSFGPSCSKYWWARIVSPAANFSRLSANSIQFPAQFGPINTLEKIHYIVTGLWVGDATDVCLALAGTTPTSFTAGTTQANCGRRISSTRLVPLGRYSFQIMAATVALDANDIYTWELAVCPWDAFATVPPSTVCTTIIPLFNVSDGANEVPGKTFEGDLSNLGPIPMNTGDMLMVLSRGSVAVDPANATRIYMIGWVEAGL